MSFRSEVKGVRPRRDRIVANPEGLCDLKVFIYNFADLKVLRQIETIANPKGLCEVSHVSGTMVLVCPGLQKGQVRVEHYASKRTKFIMEHDSRIACFALTQVSMKSAGAAVHRGRNRLSRKGKRVQYSYMSLFLRTTPFLNPPR